MKTKKKPGRPVNKEANRHHLLYDSWKGHRQRGALLTTPFKDFVANAIEAGWRPDVGYRVFVDPITEAVSMYRAIYDFVEYGLWIRMMTEGSLDGKSRVCVRWHNFFNFRDWVHGLGLGLSIDYRDRKICVARKDTSRIFCPDNCFLHGGI